MPQSPHTQDLAPVALPGLIPSAVSSGAGGGVSGSPAGQPCLPRPRTNHQDVDGCLGLQALQTYGELIASRVGALGRADEEDGVLVPGTYIHPLAVQGVAIMGPRRLRPGTPLGGGGCQGRCRRRQHPHTHSVLGISRAVLRGAGPVGPSRRCRCCSPPPSPGVQPALGPPILSTAWRVTTESCVQQREGEAILVGLMRVS